MQNKHSLSTPPSLPASAPSCRCCCFGLGPSPLPSYPHLLLDPGPASLQPLPTHVPPAHSDLASFTPAAAQVVRDGGERDRGVVERRNSNCWREKKRTEGDKFKNNNNSNTQKVFLSYCFLRERTGGAKAREKKKKRGGRQVLRSGTTQQWEAPAQILWQ